MNVQYAWILLALVAPMLHPIAHADAIAPQTQPAGDDEQKELAKKLIRGPSTQDRDVMAAVLNLMERVQDKLKKDFDPGPQTQTAQKEIIKQLDAAIASAQRQRSSNASSSSSDKRRTEPARPSPDSKSVQPQSTAGASNKSTTTAPASAASNSKLAGELRETRRSWGHLPSRDRDELIQSEYDAILNGFRPLADRYFRALAESEEDDRP
ncbi:MAG TPA: hypothetical protein VGM03_13500 [Phycisphaerae bacterium]|jgi:hypothetical protein